MENSITLIFFLNEAFPYSVKHRTFLTKSFVDLLMCQLFACFLIY